MSNQILYSYRPVGGCNHQCFKDVVTTSGSTFRQMLVGHSGRAEAVSSHPGKSIETLMNTVQVGAETSSVVSKVVSGTYTPPAQNSSSTSPETLAGPNAVPNLTVADRKSTDVTWGLGVVEELKNRGYSNAEIMAIKVKYINQYLQGGVDSTISLDNADDIDAIPSSGGPYQGNPSAGAGWTDALGDNDGDGTANAIDFTPNGESEDAGGEPGYGAGNGIPQGSSTPVSTPPPRTEAQKAADFDRMVAEYNTAKAQAAAGNPKMLQDLDGFFGITDRNPAEYTREFYMPKNGLSLAQNDAIVSVHTAQDINKDGLVDRKELNDQNVELQYDNSVWADGGISRDEMVALVQKRAQQGMINTVDFTKADLGKAVDTLVGSSGYNRVFNTTQVTAIEKKLEKPLPDAIKKDGKVSEQELTDYLAGQIKEGYLSINNGKLVEGSRVAEEEAITVAVNTPPVPAPVNDTTQPEAGSDTSSSLGSGGLNLAPDGAPSVNGPRMGTNPVDPNKVYTKEEKYAASLSGTNLNPSGAVTGGGPRFTSNIIAPTTSSPTVPDKNTPEAKNPTSWSNSTINGTLPTTQVVHPEVSSSPQTNYSRDTKDSGFAYPWSAAKSIGASDVPATIEKAVGFMNSAEGKQYHYDKVKGTITSKDGGFITKDDVQALNNIIVKYHKAGFALPDKASTKAHQITGGAIGAHSNRPVLDGITGGAVRIDGSNGSSLSNIGTSGVAGAAVKPRPVEGGLNLP